MKQKFLYIFVILLFSSICVFTFVKARDKDFLSNTDKQGMLTLLGIDSDKDGVRNDIQQYIYSEYKDDEAAKLVLIELAKLYQTTLIQADDTDASYNNATKAMRLFECLRYINNRSARKILNSFDRKFFNTKERLRVYDQFEENISGKVFPSTPISARKYTCPFDVDNIK